MSASSAFVHQSLSSVPCTPQIVQMAVTHKTLFHTLITAVPFKLFHTLVYIIPNMKMNKIKDGEFVQIELFIVDKIEILIRVWILLFLTHHCPAAVMGPSAWFPARSAASPPS